MDQILISNSDYGTLCFMAGLGWGLFVTTLGAAVLIDQIKWGRWINRRG